MNKVCKTCGISKIEHLDFYETAVLSKKTMLPMYGGKCRSCISKENSDRYAHDEQYRKSKIEYQRSRRKEKELWLQTRK